MKLTLTLVLLMPLVGSYGLTTEKVVPEAAKALLGSWQDKERKEKLLRFEPARVTVAEKDRLTFFRASYQPGKVLLHGDDPKRILVAEVTDGVLTLTSPDGKKRAFRKLDAVPPKLELKPLPLGKAGELPADKIKAIQEELSRRLKSDQEIRTNPAKIKDIESAAKVDVENTTYLKKLIQEIGWIDVDRFGAEASSAAFLLVQHSGDLPLMLAALPLIKKDTKAKKFRDGQKYALLYDRLQLRLGYKQKYGTQFVTMKGELCVLPLQDRAKVDEFRKELGLFPLQRYLDIARQYSGGAAVKFLDD